MSDHTPTPWRNVCFQIYGADKSRIAHTGMGQLPPYRSSESEANAAFIVKAVNNHDALVRHLHHLATVCCDEDALRLIDSINGVVGSGVSLPKTN